MIGVIELRQYTLKPGRRDELIALFEREFIESQEAEGMAIIGTFRDASDADRFVWLRGFADMEARARSLQAFYTGTVWMAHREAANATMIDSDNVLLLRPAWAGSVFLDIDRPPPTNSTSLPPAIVTANICYFDVPVAGKFVESMRQWLPHYATEKGGTLAAALVTEPAANNFSRLPVREGENVFVWFTIFRQHPAEFDLSDEMTSRIARREVLQLRSTPRSRLV